MNQPVTISIPKLCLTCACTNAMFAYLPSTSVSVGQFTIHDVSVEMIRRLVSALLILFLSQLCNAQVSGRITESDSSGVPFATVMLLRSADSVMIGATMTNERGEYMIDKISPGTYIQRVSSMGYQTHTSALIEFKAELGSNGVSETVTYNLGDQILQPESQQLGEVLIKAERPLFEQRPDGIVVNVGSSVMTKGSTVMQLIERSPGVRVDLQSNTLEMNGKNGVMVMLNGKMIRLPVEQLTGFLNGISANDIATIELLTTPPAGFDAEGSGGVINIVTKKSVNAGTTGSFVASAGYGFREKAMAGFNVNHETEKVTFYGSYNYARDRSSTNFIASGNEQEPLLGGYASSLFKSTAIATQQSHNVNAGIDAIITKRTGIGGSINFNTSRTPLGTVNSGIYHVENDSIYDLNAAANSTNQWRNLITNLYAEHRYANNQKITIDADYLGYQNNYPTSAVNSFLSSGGYQAGLNDTLFSPVSRGLSNTRIDVGVLKMDYTKIFKSHWRFETGAKATANVTSGRSVIENLIEDEYVTRAASKNSMMMHEWIAAAYALIDASLDSSMHFNIGLRYEYSHTQIDNRETGASIADRKLGKLFPNISFTKKLNARSDISITYARRISRPTYSDLASFVTPNGPTSVNTGNPLLKPTLTDNMKIGFNHSGYALSILFSRDKHPIARSQSVYTSDKMQMAISPQNLIYQNNLLFQTNIPVHLNNWWEMNYGAIAGWRKFELDYTADPARKTYFAYSIQMNQTIQLPYRIAFEVSGYFNSKTYNGSRKVDGNGIVNAGVKMEFKKGGVLQLALNDIFKTGSFSSYFGALTREAFDLQTHVVYHPEASLYQTARLTYTKTFGSGRNNVRKKSNGSESERDRIDH